MDHLDSHLLNVASNLKYLITMKAALSIGKKTLNCYYDKTDHSKVFRIAMGKPHLMFSLFLSNIVLQYTVLHPRHKLQYFKNVNWLPQWINIAKNIIRKEFEHSYALGDIEAVDPESVSNFICIFNRH